MKIFALPFFHIFVAFKGDSSHSLPYALWQRFMRFCCCPIVFVFHTPFFLKKWEVCIHNDTQHDMKFFIYLINNNNMSHLFRIQLIALLSLITLSVSAQKDWEWEHHHIAFTLADDFKPVTNTNDEFSAVGDGMEFSIFPFSDQTLDHSNITTYTISIAESLKLERLDDVDLLEMNGLKGAYVEGYKEGNRIVMLGFIDPSTETNFFATITFADDDQEAVNEAVRIIKSFRRK
jgi:hypothetical protein